MIWTFSRINQANGAFAMMKCVSCSKDNIPAKLRVQLYDATVTNILLWGCESTNRRTTEEA
jgi:hypothetical protein